MIEDQYMAGSNGKVLKDLLDITTNREIDRVETELFFVITDQLMDAFQQEFLEKYTPCVFDSRQDVVAALAIVHTELILIQSEFDCLYNPGDPIRNNRGTLDSINEVRIIQRAV